MYCIETFAQMDDISEIVICLADEWKPFVDESIITSVGGCYVILQSRIKNRHVKTLQKVTALFFFYMQGVVDLMVTM